MNKRQTNKYLRLFGHRLKDGEVASKKVRRRDIPSNLPINHPEVRRKTERSDRERARVLPALLRSKMIDDESKMSFAAQVKNQVPAKRQPWVERGGRPRQRLRGIVRLISHYILPEEGETWTAFYAREEVYLSGLILANPKLVGKRISGVRTRLSQAS